MLIATAPNWAEALTGIGSVLAGASFFVGAIGVLLTWNQLRDARQDRHVEILTELARRWDEPRLTEPRVALLKRDNQEHAAYVKKCLDHPTSGDLETLLRVPNFFEEMAVLVLSGAIDKRLLGQVWSTLILTYWAYWQLSIEELRARRGSQAYVQFERLVDLMAQPDPPPKHWVSLLDPAG